MCVLRWVGNLLLDLAFGKLDADLDGYVSRTQPTTPPPSHNDHE